MSVATDFRKWLLSKSSITALVRTNICQLAVQHPRSTPYIVFRRMGAYTEKDLDGQGGCDRTTLEVNVCGGQGDDVDGIVDRLKEAVDGYPFSPSDNTWNGRTIQFAEVTDITDDYEYLPVASDDVIQQAAFFIEVYSDG